MTETSEVNIPHWKLYLAVSTGPIGQRPPDVGDCCHGGCQKGALEGGKDIHFTHPFFSLFDI